LCQQCRYDPHDPQVCPKHQVFRVKSSGLLFLWERPSTWTGAPFTFLALYLVGRLERNRAQCCALLAGDHCPLVLVPPRTLF
jgi:hypothetical protein